MPDSRTRSVAHLVRLGRPFLEKLERTFARNLFHWQGAARDLERHLFVNELVVETDRGGVAPRASVEYSIEPRPVNGGQTHWAGFARGIKFAAAKIEAAERAAGFADRHHFSVRGGVEQGCDLIVPATDDFLLTNHHRTEGPAVILPHAGAA